MNELPFYKDYFWKNGKPIGRGSGSVSEDKAFRVIKDPYGKRYSIEKYFYGKFIEVIYDSSLFDFRQLQSKEIEAWQKEYMNEQCSFIRNIEDRVILIEEYQFPICKILSPHGVWIATQHLLKISNGDAFNGMLLEDRLNHPILIKYYENEEFTKLINEKWDHAKTPF